MLRGFSLLRQQVVGDSDRTDWRNWHGRNEFDKYVFEHEGRMVVSRPGWNSSAMGRRVGSRLMRN